MRQRVRPMMKRNESALGGAVKEFVVPERSTNDDRPMKRCGMESRVSSEDITSISSKGLEDEFRTPWLLHSSIN
jgi:hypothetical protein